MTVRSRILDLLPLLLVVALVSAFATFMVVERVLREPLVVPPPRTTPEAELPQPDPAGASVRR